MIRTLIYAIAVLALVGTTFAEAQTRPRTPKRPPWQDVCCGGPCCRTHR